MGDSLSHLDDLLNEANNAENLKMAAYHCCVPLCVNDSRKQNPEISFHSFPTDPKRRAEWIVKIRRDPGYLFQVCF